MEGEFNNKDSIHEKLDKSTYTKDVKKFYDDWSGTYDEVSVYRVHSRTWEQYCSQGHRGNFEQYRNCDIVNHFPDRRTILFLQKFKFQD